MMMMKIQRTTKIITIHPEVDMKTTKFIFVAILDEQSGDHQNLSTWDHECLYKLLCQSI